MTTVNRQNIERRATRFWREMLQNLNKCLPVISKVHNDVLMWTHSVDTCMWHKTYVAFFFLYHKAIRSFLAIQSTCFSTYNFIHIQHTTRNPIIQNVVHVLVFSTCHVISCLHRLLRGQRTVLLDVQSRTSRGHFSGDEYHAVDCQRRCRRRRYDQDRSQS